MSDSNLDYVRLKLGYIKPGEQHNKFLFWGNIIIFTSLVVLVGVLFACHNKRDITSESQEKELLAFGILSAVILGFFALPINIWDGMSYHRKGVYTVSKHPMYAFLMILSILLLATVGIYYGVTGKNESDQKSLLIVALIMLGIIIIVSYLVFEVVNRPYGWLARFLKVQALGDNEFYAINPELFNNYKSSEKIYYKINKYIEGKKLENDDVDSLGNLLTADEKTKMKNNDFENIVFQQKLIGLRNTNKTLMETNKKQLYNLGDFKNQYNIGVSKIEKERDLPDRQRQKQVLELFKELTNKNKTIDLPTRTMQKLEEKIRNSTDGRLKPKDYSDIFGYYDNTTGITNLGINNTLQGMEDNYEKVVEGLFEAKLYEEFEDKISNGLRMDLNDNSDYKTVFDDFIKQNLKSAAVIARAKNGIVKLDNSIVQMFEKLTGEECKGFDFSKENIFDGENGSINYDNVTRNDQIRYTGEILDNLKDCLKKVRIE